MFKPFSHLQIASVVLLLSLLGSVVVSLVMFNSYEKARGALLEEELTSFENVASLTLNGYDRLARFLFEEVINTPKVINIFKDASNADPEMQALVRERLHALLLPTYERMKSVKLEQLHFHLSDVTSFLRFHKPEKYGDALNEIRYSLEVANRDHVYIEGFEEGRAYNGFRYVYPLSDAYGNHLGTVETSLAFHALRDEVEAVVGHHVDFVVKQSIVERKVWHSEQKNYYTSLVSSDYLHEKSAYPGEEYRLRSDRINLNIASEATARMREGERFALYNDACVVTFIPIQNIQGEAAAAYLIGYKDTSVITMIRRDAWINWALMMGILFAVFFSMYKLGLQRLKLNDITMHDPLTHLLNQRTLIQRMEHEILRAKRTKDTFSVIYLDVDDFKVLNDRFGRRRCDALLVEMAEVLERNIRRNDAISRWSAESFMVCLPHTSCDAAAIVAQKLHRAVLSHDFSIAWPMTCSVGVTDFHEEDSVETLVERVETNLLQAKAQGKNRILDV